jgi:thioesterase domain-containing protein
MLASTKTGTAHAVNGFPAPMDEVFVFPATVGQQGFWYLDQLQPGNPAYNIAVRFRLQGALDVDALVRAMNEIVRRHEALRTVLGVVDGVPVQVILPRLSITIPRDDLRDVSDALRAARAQERATEEGRRRFDLAKGPLVRARLLRLEDEEHVLLVTVHHVVSDGWSIGVMTRELGVLYEAFVRGLASPLPELPIQYGDYAVWQEKWLGGRDLRDQIAYWRRQLADPPTLEVPTDRPRTAAQAPQGTIVSILLPRDLTDRLDALALREKATPFMLMLAAFQLLLQRWCGWDDLVVGSVVAGRARAELEPLIGLFINPVVLRTDLSGEPTFVELLARVREVVLQAFAHQETPFDRVVDAVQPKRVAGRHPLFQINFLYQRDFVQPFQTAGLTLTAIPSVSPGAIYDLNFFLVERADGWRASVEYNTELYNASTIGRVLREFQGLLRQVAANPAAHISGYAVAPAADNGDQTVHGGQAAGAPYAGPRDAVEARLVELWERVLGVNGISVNSDFFDVGGHSLLAARLLAEVGKAFGRTLSLGCLLQCPTVESLAAMLRRPEDVAVVGGAQESRGLADESWVAPEGQVFPMRRGGTKPPLVIVDAGPFHRPLVRRLGSDQPVLGIALPALSALPDRFTVKDVAANLVNALCESELAGPYYLAGWSQAGVIAYEMAQQLRSRGKEVALVILLDSANPNYIRRLKRWWMTPIRLYLWLTKAGYQLSKRRGMPISTAWRHFRERMRKFHQVSPGKRPVPAGPEEGQEVWRVQYLAANDCDPRPCDWPLLLVRSSVLRTGWFRDPRLGWGEVAGAGLEVHAMPGEHDTMFLEPDVERLASIIADRLRA